MSNRPGHVDVTTEVGYCNFCQRTRNLRREAHHLGQLVRTIVSCETCHRTLSTTMGVAATPEPVKEESPAAAETAPEVEPKPKRRAPAKRATATKAGSKAGSKAAAKPKSAATRQTSKKK